MTVEEKAVLIGLNLWGPIPRIGGDGGGGGGGSAGVRLSLIRMGVGEAAATTQSNVILLQRRILFPREM